MAPPTDPNDPEYAKYWNLPPGFIIGELNRGRYIPLEHWDRNVVYSDEEEFQARKKQIAKDKEMDIDDEEDDDEDMDVDDNEEDLDEDMDNDDDDDVTAPIKQRKFAVDDKPPTYAPKRKRDEPKKASPKSKKTKTAAAKEKKPKTAAGKVQKPKTKKPTAKKPSEKTPRKKKAEQDGVTAILAESKKKREEAAERARVLGAENAAKGLRSSRRLRKRSLET